MTEFSIVVSSADTKHWSPAARRVVQSRQGSDGLFVFGDLPPGEYFVCAVTDVEATQLFDPSLLQQLVPSAFRIAMAAGQKKRQHLRVGRNVRRIGPEPFPRTRTSISPAF